MRVMQFLDEPLREVISEYLTKYGERYISMAHNNTNLLERVFGRSRVFLPVIHPKSSDLALGAIETAVNCDADGIFLINEGMDAWELLDFIPEIHRRFDGLWIGLNLVGFDPESVIGLISDLPVAGLWSDNSGVVESQSEQPSAQRFHQARQESAWQGLYFAGVAFKYQRHVPDDLLPMAAQKVCPYVDVIVTSGTETGLPPSVEKVKSLRAGAGSHPLAIASGVSPENVSRFLPYVDAYLVASAIETKKYSGVLIPERTKLLADQIHGWTEDDSDFA